MVMSAKTEFWISVIGLSGRENGESFQGSGKSCLCDRFMFPEKPPSFGHTSIISQQDFHGPIVNTDHFLYWGRTRRTVDGKMVEFNIIEQTEFLDDVTFSPFNARDPYMKRATSTTINSSRKVQYCSPEHLQDPKSQKAQRFTSRKLHIDGFLCVYDVSKVNDRQAGTQYKFVFELLDLIDVPVVLVATKCDKGRSRHFEEMMYLAKVQKVPIVETSALENVNVAQAFFSLVRIFNRQVIISKKHIQYFNPKELVKKNKKNKKMGKKGKKQNSKGKNEEIEDVVAKRNGSVASKNGSILSGDWLSGEVLLRSNPDSGSLFPTPRDSPLTDSLLSDPPDEPPYEHINGVGSPEPRLGGRDIALYENCGQDFSSCESRTFSSHDSSKCGSQENRSESVESRSNQGLSHDTESRDSQQSKSDSLQSKTSSDEYIPVPRAPYDPSENYENVRYHQQPSSITQNACSSPNSHSSDSDRGGFLTGIPDHMKSFQSQRPWEVSYYSNVVVEPPTPDKSDPGTSSGTRSSSSIDTDCQANINYGRQLALTSVKGGPRPHPASIGSVGSNGQFDGGSSVGSNEQPPSIPPHIPTSSAPNTFSAPPPTSSQNTFSAPPPPTIPSAQNTLPAPPLLSAAPPLLSSAPPSSSTLPPSSTLPASSTASTAYANVTSAAYANVVVSDDTQVNAVKDENTEDDVNSINEDPDLPPYPEISFTSELGVTLQSGELSRDLEEMNTLVGEISSLVWQNEPLPPPPSDYLTPSTIPDFEKTPTNELASPSPFQNNIEPDGNGFDYPIDTVNADCYENCRIPELPPRQPALPPRGSSPRDFATVGCAHVTSSQSNALTSYQNNVITVPPKPVIPQRIPLSKRENLGPYVPPRDKTMPSRDVTIAQSSSRDVTMPRTIPLPPTRSPRVSPIQPRSNNSTTATNPRGSGPGQTQTLPPRIQPRAQGMSPPQRIPGPVVRQPVSTASENGTGPPNLPPRIKADSTQGVRHEQSLVSPHMPARVPLPPGRNSANPVYTEVERPRGTFPRVIQQREFSPYVVPNAPRIDRWEEYTNSCVEKKSQTLKKKVKVKIPQR